MYLSSYCYGCLVDDGDSDDVETYRYSGHVFLVTDLVVWIYHITEHVTMRYLVVLFQYFCHTVNS